MAMNKIEKISMADLGKITNFCRSRWPDFDEWCDKNTLEYFIKKSPQYCSKCIEDKKILGVALGVEKHNCLNIVVLLVDKNQRDKGIGSKLLEHLENTCSQNNLKTIYLDSGERDYTKGSLDFYTKRGYRIVGFANIHKEKLLFFEKEL